MCGIAGLAGGACRNGNPDDVAETVSVMVDTLAHRGPDGRGVWSGKGVVLGHRRLAVIDIDNGEQPMHSESGATIVFNGEIYNFRELRAEMEAAGRTFHTESDTEVILALYDRYGTDCVEHLNGMFAFAIWDSRKRWVFLARDRVGKKPLFFHHAGGELAFASEIKALLARPGIAGNLKVNPFAVSDFLSLGYILTPKTIFDGIEKLPAGHKATYDVDYDRMVISEYWDPSPIFSERGRPFDARAEREFIELLEDAVRIRLRADVPLGTFLSGGLDSSSIAALQVRSGEIPPLSFTVGFENVSFDESGAAGDVASFLGIPFEVIREPKKSPSFLANIVWHTDEPFADTSIMPTWELNKAARSKVTVALSGDGGDEVLAGYPTYRADAFYAIYRHFPEGLRTGLSALAGAFLKPSYCKVGWDYKVRRFLAARGLSREQAHIWWRMIFSEEDVTRLMGTDLARATSGYSPLEAAAAYFGRVPKASFLNKTLYVDMKTWLQDDILVKADRMSMANSLEVRSPFLDYRLVEFMAGLEDRAKLNWRSQKAILRKAMRGRLPSRCLSRPKEGFGSPFLGEETAVLSTDRMGSILQDGVELDPGREDVTYKAFVLTVLEIWLKMFDRYQTSGEWSAEPASHA